MTSEVSGDSDFANRMRSGGDSFVPRLRGDVLRLDVEGESVVWSPISAVPARLDPVATVMLDVVDGVASIGDIASDVEEVIGLPLTIAQERVTEIIESFDEAKLLVTSQSAEDAQEAVAQRKIFVTPLNP